MDGRQYLVASPVSEKGGLENCVEKRSETRSVFSGKGTGILN